jgi:hypothetical protein
LSERGEKQRFQHGTGKTLFFLLQSDYQILGVAFLEGRKKPDFLEGQGVVKLKRRWEKN